MIYIFTEVKNVTFPKIINILKNKKGFEKKGNYCPFRDFIFSY